MLIFAVEQRFAHMKISTCIGKLKYRLYFQSSPACFSLITVTTVLCCKVMLVRRFASKVIYQGKLNCYDRKLHLVGLYYWER